MNNNKGMINVSQIVNQVAQQARDGEFVPNSGVYTAQEFVDRVCAKLRAITKGYLKKLASAEGEKEYKRQLALALAENGLTDDESIEPALNYYRSHDEWLPTPAEFVKKCLIRHVEGCPPAIDAYLEYVQNYGKKKHAWSHEIVLAAAIQSKQGGDIRCLPEAKAFPIYERSYQILMDRVLKGEDMNIPVPIALPEEPERRQHTHAENLSFMAKMREDNGI
ncbi:MAG: replication protein P [Marinomonas sp.]